MQTQAGTRPRGFAAGVTRTHNDYLITICHCCNSILPRYTGSFPVKILIIGSGGREHALAWRFAQEGHQIFGAPGNPGIAAGGPAYSHHQLSCSRGFAWSRTSPSLGRKVPLVAGVVDQFRAAGRPIFGPTQEHAQLEGSKIYAKEFMQRVGIPTARFIRVEAATAAMDALKHFDYPVVIKADGLAAGKGVIIAPDDR